MISFLELDTLILDICVPHPILIKLLENHTLHSIISLNMYYISYIWYYTGADPDLQIRGGGGGSHPDPEIRGVLVSKKFFFGLSGLIPLDLPLVPLIQDTLIAHQSILNKGLILYLSTKMITSVM